MKYTVQYRKRVIVNTDPQRRCYDGCNYSEALEWTEWEDVCRYVDLATANDSMATFARINPARQYRVVPN